MEFTPSIFPVTKELVEHSCEKENRVHTDNGGLVTRRIALPDGGYYLVFTGL